MAGLQFSLSPEKLDEGEDCEKAAFGLLEIHADGRPYADGFHDGQYVIGPYLSGYYLAEWLVWNWWRLRWEPEPSGGQSAPLEWALSHGMASIGEGYLWPLITFSCDEFQCRITGEATSADDPVPYQYRGAGTVVIPAIDFEQGVDEFVGIVLDRLSQARLTGTNLQNMWWEVSAERKDPAVARFRRIEALLGFNPDELPEERIKGWIKDAEALGEVSLSELAVGAADGMLSANKIHESTAAAGFDMNWDDAFQLQPFNQPRWGDTDAWRIGVSAANALREQAGLGDAPISSSRLAELAGMPVAAIESGAQCTRNISWVLRQDGGGDRVALRSHWKTARRFDVARLMGDRLFAGVHSSSDELLAPATRSYSYRQKAQRAFAGQLLSPWETVEGMLGADYSVEHQEDIADYFEVSQWTIGTLITNNQRNQWF